MIFELMRLLNFSVVRNFPRHSTRFAKKYFKGKGIIAVEIGTDKGINAENILENLNVKKLYIIDPYESYPEYNEKDKTVKYLSKAEKEARKRLSKYSKKIVWVKKYSEDAIKYIPNKVDFIYIEGNHSYNYAKRDMKNYYPKLTKKGIFAGHDITNPFDSWGVAKAFVEFCSEKKLRPMISRTDWFVVKNGKSKS